VELEFSRQIFANPQIPNFMKIVPVGAECFLYGRTEVLTGTTKLAVAFRDFAKSAPIESAQKSELGQLG